MTDVWYVTREAVKLALDFKETARDDTRVDEAIAAASAEIEGKLHRKFYPWFAVVKFDYPNIQYARPWRLWLDQFELISIETITSGTEEISASNYILYPTDGPPYTRIEINLDATQAFGIGSTHQNDISITGLFGYRNDEVVAGALAEALDSSETAIDVTNSALVGVGSIIRCDNERMQVTEKTMLSSGQTLQSALTASYSNETVAVSDGTAFFAHETIQLDAERMLIVSITGNNLTVRRGWDGSTLATHSGSTVYVPRTLTVVRGALGTTAATHTTATSLRRHTPPPLVTSLAKAIAIDILMQESAGYARTSGSGDNQWETKGVALAALWNRAWTTFGRQLRKRAI